MYAVDYFGSLGLSRAKQHLLHSHAMAELGLSRAPGTTSSSFRPPSRHSLEPVLEQPSRNAGATTLWRMKTCHAQGPSFSASCPSSTMATCLRSMASTQTRGSTCHGCQHLGRRSSLCLRVLGPTTSFTPSSWPRDSYEASIAAATRTRSQSRGAVYQPQGRRREREREQVQAQEQPQATICSGCGGYGGQPLASYSTAQ